MWRAGHFLQLLLLFPLTGLCHPENSKKIATMMTKAAIKGIKKKANGENAIIITPQSKSCFKNNMVSRVLVWKR